MNPLTICVLLLVGFTSIRARATAATLPIRGTLPWHNFLSGPTAWDEEDYERHLDRMKALGLNSVAFHCCTGGAERYAPYVEPLIRIVYRDILPEATLDTSLTARWGYRPLPLSEFAYGTGKLFSRPKRSGRIWLWLHEHTIYVGKPNYSTGLKALLERDGGLFKEAGEAAIFTGVWSLAYIREAYDYIKAKSPRIRLAISRWGGGNQLVIHG